MCAVFLYSVVFVYVPADTAITRIDQTPAHAVKAVGDNVSMSCNHSSLRAFQMVWYKRASLAARFILVARTGQKNVVEDAAVYRLTGDAAHSSLGVTRLRPSENGAVYFCVTTEAHTVVRDLVGSAAKSGIR